MKKSRVDVCKLVLVNMMMYASMLFWQLFGTWTRPACPPVYLDARGHQPLGPKTSDIARKPRGFYDDGAHHAYQALTECISDRHHNCGPTLQPEFIFYAELNAGFHEGMCHARWLAIPQ